jgi:hypothetical protein
MRERTTPRSATAFRLSQELHERLTTEASARGVTLNWLVNKLLDEAVEYLKPAEEMRLTRRPGEENGDG